LEKQKWYESLTSKWPVLNRSSLAGFDPLGDSEAASANE